MTTINPRFAYRRKGSDVIVEAFQIQKDDGNTHSFPGWFLDLIAERRIEYSKAAESWFLDRTEMIPTNGWVVYVPGDGVFKFAFSEAAFHEYFERLNQA